MAEPAVEYLMVPSAAMGRDIPVAFLGGGPHAVYLLDAFDAGDAASNWMTAGNAMSTLAGKGISVVTPAGGAYSLYTNWEQDGSRQWETFLSDELPNLLSANKGLAPAAAVGVAANAAVIGAGAASCPARSVAWISRARTSRLRCRPACLSADRIADRLRRAPCSGLGARPRMANVSRSCRSSKATKAAG